MNEQDNNTVQIIDSRWYRSAAAALLKTVPARRKKEFVLFMFKNRFWDQAKLTWDAAVARLNECLRTDSEKKQFLKIGELWAWMRQSGEHELFLAMADDLGYRVERIPEQSRILELLERIDRRIAAGTEAYEDAKSMRADITALMHGVRAASEPEPEGNPIRFCQAAEDRPEI